MSNPERIEDGDLVDIYFESMPTIKNARVIYPPCGEGDSWHIVLDDEKHTPVNVQRFTKMVLRAKGIEQF